MKSSTCMLGAMLLAAVVSTQAQPRDKPMPGEFVVIDGRVDAGTYAGWKLFNTACYVCHGVGGTGTDVAPNLVQRIGNYTPRGFAAKVLSSYRIVPMPDGEVADREAEREALLELLMKRERQSQGQPLMPAWDTDDEVVPHVLDLYAYLNARAAGALGPGKPKRLATPGR
ncbi:MAG TPA: c-type cytochrome [Rubrivivax sp.]|nr:c-type cytochrome [Rubrivivax sp.]